MYDILLCWQNCNYDHQFYFLKLKPIQIRLVGRFKFTAKVQGIHEHLLYHGVHSQTQESLFLKGQQYKSRPNDNFLTILQEGKILQIMQGGIGIPHMHWCGQEEDYNFIVLELLDTNLNQLLNKCGGKFSLKTVLMLGENIVSIIQYFHFKNFVNNQVHPSNLMLGFGEKHSKLFIVDFSGASRFKDVQTLQHIPDTKDNIVMRGLNLEFSSIRFNRGDAVSRKDDMESILYLMLYLLKGSLPWSELAKNKKKTEMDRIRGVLKMKIQTTIQQLYEGYNDLLMLHKYTQNLGFDEKPRYNYYKTVFKQRMEKLGYFDDKIYDWMLIEDEQEEPDVDMRFEIIPNEAEFIKQLANQIKSKEKAEEKVNKPALTPEIKSPKGKDNREKDCEIY